MGKVSIQTPTPFGIGDGTTKSFSVGGIGEVVDSMDVKSIYRADANGNNLLYQNVGPLAPGSYPQYPQGINNAICNRSTSATYIDKNGILQTAGVNVPRYQNGALLVESAATNLLSYSSSFTASAWNNTVSTLTAGATTGVDGLVSGWLYTSQATGYIDHGSYPSELDTLYAIIKKSSSRWALLTNKTFADGSEVAWFDLYNLVPGITGSNVIATIRPIGNDGWLIISITKNQPTTSEFTIIRPAPANGNTGADGDAMYLYGVQRETTLQPTSYIPTTNAPVTRAADQIVISDYTVS